MLTFTSVEFLTAPINNIFANVGSQTKVQYILKYQDINVFVRIAKDIYVFRNDHYENKGKYKYEFSSGIKCDFVLPISNQIRPIWNVLPI